MRKEAKEEEEEEEEEGRTIPLLTTKRKRGKQIKKTQDELQWIVAQRLLSALTIPGFT